MDKTKIKPNYNLFKRLPVKNNDENIQKILDLNKNTKDFKTEFLTLNNIEKTIEICHEDSIGKFIKSSFNKLGDSYRSPWTNKFFPELNEPIYPPEIFREMEKAFNEIYSLYAKLYYGNDAVSSVYIWEQGDSLENGFNIALLIDNQKDFILKKNCGIMNSINLINVKYLKEKEKNLDGVKVVYKIFNTINFKLFLSQNPTNESESKTDIIYSGSINKQIEEGTLVKSFLDINSHVERIGKIIEAIENNIRGSLDEIYLKKTKDIIEGTRKSNSTFEIPLDFLKSKEDMIISMQDYWNNKMNFGTDYNSSFNTNK